MRLGMRNIARPLNQLGLRRGGCRSGSSRALAGVRGAAREGGTGGFGRRGGADGEGWVFEGRAVREFSDSAAEEGIG